MEGVGDIYKLLAVTPASGISAHNTSSGCQALSSYHVTPVTVRPRITGTKQLRHLLLVPVSLEDFSGSGSEGSVLVKSFFLHCDHRKDLTASSIAFRHVDVVKTTC